MVWECTGRKENDVTMFKVKKKETGKIYTVFAVQKDKFACTEFLIYDETWDWVWQSPLDYVPVEVEDD